MRLPKTRREAEIWHACDLLLSELLHPKKVTGEKIMAQLMALGLKRGCPNEIYKYRRTWWEVRGITEAEATGISDIINQLNLYVDVSDEKQMLRNQLQARNRTIKELKRQISALLAK